MPRNGVIEEFKKLINNRYIADGRYSNVSVATVIEEGIAPKDMVSGKKLYHSYNGEVTVKGAADSYEITFADLPQKVCVELGILNWTVDNSSDLVSMNINGKSFKWPWVEAAINCRRRCPMWPPPARTVTRMWLNGTFSNGEQQ